MGFDLVLLRLGLDEVAQSKIVALQRKSGTHMDDPRTSFIFKYKFGPHGLPD